MNEGSYFLTRSFSNRDNALAIEPQFNLEVNVNPSIIKDDFSLGADPSIFTSIAPVLLD